MIKNNLLNIVLKKNPSLVQYQNIIPIVPNLEIKLIKPQIVNFSSTNKWNKNNNNNNFNEELTHEKNMVNISPNAIEIIRIKNKAMGEELHPQLKSYKDIQVGKIIENKIQNNIGKIVKVSEISSVWDAIKVMNDKKVGATIVVDRNNRMSGIFSERDYLSKVDLRSLSPKDTLVKDVMTHKVITVSGDSGASRCLSIMSKRNIRHLPVIDNKRLIGMLSIGDLVKYIITVQSNEINELKNDIDK